MAPNDRAISEIFGLFLIAFLIFVAILLIIASLTGVMTIMLQKTALIVVTASPAKTGPASHIILLYHKQGDLVNLNTTSQSGGTSDVAITLAKYPGQPVLVRNATPIKASAWGPGQSLYIIPVAGGYGYTDIPPAPGTELTSGNYTVEIIDAKVNIVLHSLPVTIP